MTKMTKLMLLMRYRWMHTCTPRLDRSFCWTSATTFVCPLLNHTLHNGFPACYMHRYICMCVVCECQLPAIVCIHAIFTADIVWTIFSISYEVQCVMFPSYKAESARVLLKVTCLPIGRELVYKLPRQKMLNALITSPPSSFNFIFIQVLRLLCQKGQQLAQGLILKRKR